MARKSRNTGLAHVILEGVSRLPWWVGILLALVAYLTLHTVALRPVAAQAVPGQMGAMAVGMIWRTLASIGQYLLPALCLIAALVSFVRQRQSGQLVETAIQSDSATQTLNSLTWQEFERLVGEAYRRQGYSVKETGRGGPDGGVDLELRRHGELHLVQCKQWRAQRVGVEVVRQLYGVMAAQGAASGIVVSAGRFTDEAQRFAEGRNIRLKTGQALHAMVRAGSVPTPLDSANRPVHSSNPPPAPACQKCSKPMVMRTAKRGEQIGRSFWGCTGFPTCRGAQAAD